MRAFPKGVCVAAVLVAAAMATQCQQVKHAEQSHPPDLDYEIVLQTSLVNNGITVDVLRVCTVATTPAHSSTRMRAANKAVADITAKGWPVDEQGKSKAIMVVWLLPDKVTEQGVFMYAPNVPFSELYGKPSPSAAPQAKARQRTSGSTRVTKPTPSKQEMEGRQAERPT